MNKKQKQIRTKSNRTELNRTEQNRHYVVRLANVAIIHSSWNAMCDVLVFFSCVCALNVIHQLRAPVNVLCMCLSQHFYSSHSIILLCSLAIFLPLWIYTRVHVRNLLMRRKSAYVFYPVQFENEVLAILTSPKPCTVYIRLEVEGTYALVRLINRFVNIENLERKNSGYCYWKHMKHSQHWTKRWITEQRKSSILRTYIIFYPSNDNRYSSCLSLSLSLFVLLLLFISLIQL